jgi:cardiolipin synthase
VAVVIPRQSDIPWFKHAGRRTYASLLRSGVEVWERCDRMVHAKVAVADRAVAAMGSVNLNGLSFFNNSETLMLTDDTHAVEEVHSLLTEEAMQHSETLSFESWSRHPDRRRWAELLAMTACLL